MGWIEYTGNSDLSYFNLENIVSLYVDSEAQLGQYQVQAKLVTGETFVLGTKQTKEQANAALKELIGVVVKIG